MSSETLTTGPIGWFGKLPAAGDFLQRDLPNGFVTAWDAWLQAGMAAGSQAHGDDWQDNFLRFPVWYFLRRHPADGDAGRPLWAGILVPSVDRVGRLFPLTIAFDMPGALFLRHGIGPVEHRLDEIAALALDVLGDDDLPAFEQATGALEPLAAAATPLENDSGSRHPVELVESLGRQALLERLTSHALFWTTGDQPRQSLLLAPEPLQADAFCELVRPSTLPILSE